jgi:nicotinamidase-related amidase
MQPLDPIAALVVIDLQKSVVKIPTVHPTTDIVERTARLASAFRARRLPVVLVNVSGAPPGRTSTPRPPTSLAPDWSELVAELDQQATDLLVTKQRWGAFIGTSLNADLRQRGVTQIVLTGISTSAGVESTARSAYDFGYNVLLVTDAMTDRDADTHRFTVEKIFPRLGETATTDEVLAHYGRNVETP